MMHFTHRLGATTLVFVLALIVVTVSEARAQQAAAPVAAGVQSQDLHLFRSVGVVQFSPDGSLIAYTVQNREGPGRPYDQIWILDRATGQAKVLAGTEEGASNPVWSPDGRWIAYSGRRQGRSGVVISRPDGSEARLVAEVMGTNHPLPRSGASVAWSPDSRQIGFVSATPGPEPEEESEAGDPIVIRRYTYKTTGSDGFSYFNDNRRMHLFMADLEDGEVRQLTDGEFFEHSIAWSPTGEEILFVSNREPDHDLFFTYDLFALRVADGRIRQLTSLESVVYDPRWSPDGRTVAYLGTRRGLTSSETAMEDTHLWLMDADRTNRRELGADIDNRQGRADWSVDGRHVYFTVQERGHERLYRRPAAGGAPEVVIGVPGRVGSWSVAPDGSVAYAFHTAGDLPQLYLTRGGDTRKLTDLNQELLASRAIAPTESVLFETLDGFQVESFLTLPLRLEEAASRRHPLIVMIKGGPHGQQGPILDVKVQAYAARGWATLMVNYRGSTGYGQAFTDAIFRDQNGGEAMDVLQGTEAVLRRYRWLDPARVGVEGGSHGGQLSNWLITQTDRFAAAIPRASISSLVSHNYMPAFHNYLAVEYGGFPHQAGIMDMLWERSAIRYVAQVRTPTMLVHGINDHLVSKVEAEQFYIALRDVGVETELVLYPRAGHGIYETAQNVDFIDRSIAWYEKHFARRLATGGGP